MEIRIEAIRTIWVGMTESQMQDLAKLIGYMQRGDLGKFCERMGVSGIEFDSINETLSDLKKVMNVCQTKLENSR